MSVLFLVLYGICLVYYNVSYWYFIVDGFGIGVECLWGRKKVFVCIDIDNKKGIYKFRNVVKNIFLKVKIYVIKEYFV